MGDSDKNPPQPSPQSESPLGQHYVGLAGVVAIMAYLVLFAAADLYVVVRVWPPTPVAQPSPTPPSTPTPTPATSPAPNRAAFVLTVAAASPTPTPGSSAPGGGQKQPGESASPTPTPGVTLAVPDPGPWPVYFFWGGPYTFYTNSALFLIVMLCGAMGSLLHALRSFYWYTGNRKLIWSWAAMYILLPFNGALLATVFYLTVRGGFGNSSSVGGSAFGYAAASA